MRLSLALFSVLFFMSSVVVGGAKEHFINGREYYEEGQYVAAIEEFEKAYALDPKPAFLYNVAQCSEKLGKLRQAVTYLERFLREDEEQTDTEAIKSKISSLEVRISETGITVTSPDEGAKIYVDSELLGVTPREGVIPVPEGMHAVRIAKPGFEPFTMNVGVSTGYSVPVYAKLEPAGEQSATRVVGDATAGTTEADTPNDDANAIGSTTESEATDDGDSVPGERDNADGQKRTPSDVAPWVIAGTGAAIAVAGFAGIGTVAMVRSDESLAHVSDAVGWPGVAIAAGGAIWGIVRLVKKKKESRSAWVAPALNRYVTGVAAGLTF